MFGSLFGNSKPEALAQNDEQAFALSLAAMYRLDAVQDMHAIGHKVSNPNDINAIKPLVIQKFCRLDMGESSGREARNALSQSWGVTTYEELMEQLATLRENGQRGDYDSWIQLIEEFSITPSTMNDPGLEPYLYDPHHQQDMRPLLTQVLRTKDQLGPQSIIGWDIARYINLIRLGYLAGILKSDEAWDLAQECGHFARTSLHSWNEFATSFLIGRLFWQQQEHDFKFEAVLNELQKNEL